MHSGKGALLVCVFPLVWCFIIGPVDFSLVLSLVAVEGHFSRGAFYCCRFPPRAFLPTSGVWLTRLGLSCTWLWRAKYSPQVPFWLKPRSCRRKTPAPTIFGCVIHINVTTAYELALSGRVHEPIKPGHISRPLVKYAYHPFVNALCERRHVSAATHHH